MRKTLAVLAYAPLTAIIACASLLLTIALSPVYAWAICSAMYHGKPEEQRG